VSELLFITIKVSPGDLSCSWRFHSYVEIENIAVLSHDLCPKGFHSGRDKSALEGMAWTLTMIGASEGALSGTARRIKNLNSYF
jgi:hypothetical protein